MVIRVEGMRYDKDTQYAQLSLVYRFYRIDEQAIKVLAPINSTMRPCVMPYESIMAGDWQQGRAMALKEVQAIGWKLAAL